MTTESLAEFELLVMLAVLCPGREEPYAVSIAEDVSGNENRRAE